MKRKIIGLILCSIFALSVAGCQKAGDTGVTVTVNDDKDTSENTSIAENISAGTDNTDSEEVSEMGDEIPESDSIYIVYTNDIHSHIYNVVKDDNDNDVPGLRLANISAMVSKMRDEGKNVILVDAGDELQGDVYGAFDSGESVVSIMNECGYQLATPGNHDFDYGVSNFFNRKEEANYPYISCNFHSLEGDANPLAANYVYEAGNRKVAFIGITTPETITSSTPVYFQNSKGEYIYEIDGTDDAKNLYAAVQRAIDDVRDSADYVIALAHVGVGLDEKRNGLSSYDVISNVEGLDAYIDGHSHTVMEKELVKDKTGKEVLLTQTGSYLEHVGIMEISEDGITSQLVDSYEESDETVAKLEDEIQQNIMEKMGEKIAVLDSTLYINDPDNSDRRLIRSREMNSGDLVSDSVYWYFNNIVDINCDIVMSNGGGIREQLASGDVTYMDVKSIEPFGNMICLIEASGQQILDALEMGATVIGEWDDAWDIPAENGGFMQVAGMRYTIDSTVPTSVKTTEDGMFKSVDGAYRVKDVEIYDKSTGEYEALDVNKTYNVGGINYILRNSGNGLSMFGDDRLIVDYVGQDYVILSQYLINFEKDGEYPVVNSKNSPLNELPGYDLDYENPYGAGRISIIMN